MTLPLETAAVVDDTARRALDRLAQQFPLGVGTDNFQQVPQVRVTNAAFSVGAGAAVVVTFANETWDIGTPSLNMHDTVSNTSRLTCRVAGLYDIVAWGSWAAAAGGTRSVGIQLNGATVIGNQDGVPNTFNTKDQSVPTQYRLAVNDYVEMRVFQNTAGALNIAAEFMMAWRSP